MGMIKIYDKLFNIHIAVIIRPYIGLVLRVSKTQLNHTSEMVGDQHFQKWWMSLGDQRFKKHYVLFNLTIANVRLSVELGLLNGPKIWYCESPFSNKIIGDL